eukprot:tig00021612_g22900.t1
MAPRTFQPGRAAIVASSPKTHRLLAFAQPSQMAAPDKPNTPPAEDDEATVAIAAPPMDSFLENMIAGSMSRGVSQAILHPIDVLRTRSQAIGVTSKLQARTFLKGIAPCLLLSVPAGGMQFVTYEYMKEKLTDLAPENRMFVQLTAGASGALAASVVRVPQEILKQRVQADVYPNMIATIQGILSTDGPRGFYTGYLSTVLRDVPFNATAFLFFEQFKGTFVRTNSRDPENWENLAMGAMSGGLSALIWTPIDVVKTRLMTQKPGQARKYNGILDTFKKVANEEGPQALMKGVVPRLVYLSPMSAITFSVYEAIKGAMRHQKAVIGKDDVEDSLESNRGRKPKTTAFQAPLAAPNPFAARSHKARRPAPRR